MYEDDDYEEDPWKDEEEDVDDWDEGVHHGDDMIILKDTRCCAIQEISGLMRYVNPKNAMCDFCSLNFGSRHTTTNYYGLDAIKQKLFSYYLFTCGIECEGNEDNYAVQFARFIKENNLGDVWESPILENVAYHPGEHNQIFIWMPDHDAVYKWWNRNKEAEK